MRVIPTLKHYCGIVSDITSGSMYGIFMLTFYLTFFAAYTLKFYPTFNLASILRNFLTFFLAFYLASIPTFYLPSFQAFILALFLAYKSGISSGILSGISSEILCGSGPPELAVEVRREGNTLILSLRWRYDGEHFDPEVAIGVRRGTQRSRACSWGPVRSWARRKEGRKEGGGGGQADIKSNYLLRVIPTKTFYLTHSLTFYLAYVLTFFWKNFLAGKRRRGQLWWNLATFVGL